MLLKHRDPPYFDARDVPDGPSPLPLSNGNYFFLYNTDNGKSIPKYGHCSIGWTILNGTNPIQILVKCFFLLFENLF